MKPKNYWSEKIRWQAPAEGVPAAEAVPAVESAPDFSFIPTDFHTDGKPDTAKFSAHYQELVAAAAQQAEVVPPAVPESYDFAVPADLDFSDLGLPEGFNVELDAASEEYAPLFAEFGGLLKELGAPAEAAQKATGLLARYEAVKAARDYKAWAEDMKALGTETQIKARVDVVQRKLETMLPGDQVKALFSGDRISAAGIKALELILKPKSFGTAQPNPNTGLEGLSAYDRLKAINAATMKT